MWVISLLENAKHEARPTQVSKSIVFMVCIGFIAMNTISLKRLAGLEKFDPLEKLLNSGWCALLSSCVASPLAFGTSTHHVVQVNRIHLLFSLSLGPPLGKTSIEKKRFLSGIARIT